jgi:MFS family permease
MSLENRNNMDLEITENQRRLSRKYLIYEALTNFWFVNAIWLYFYHLFITDHQIGILDGFAFTIGLIAEVPSGVLADRFGKDRIVKLGQVLASIGFIIQGLGSGFWAFFIGQSIMMVGVSFISGADQALFFSKLNFESTSIHWRKLLTRGSQIALIVTLFATIVGGLLYSVNPRLPWILSGIACLCSALWIWSLKDDRSERSSQKFLLELKGYLLDIKKGFDQFFMPKLQSYIPIILIVQGVFYTASWGLLRVVLLERFYFNPFWGSIVIASSSILTVIILALIHKYAHHMNEKHVITLISFSAAAGLLLSIADIGMWGYVVIFVLYAGDHILQPFMSEIINNRVTDDQRATVLSVASFLRTLPYIALAPLIGFLNENSHLGYFLLSWAVFICIAVFVYLYAKKVNKI